MANLLRAVSDRCAHRSGSMEKIKENKQLNKMKMRDLIKNEITRVEKLIAWLRLYPDGEPPYQLIRKLKRSVRKATEILESGTRNVPHLENCLKDLGKANIFFDEY